MISTPASSQRRIWSIVALASEVSVLVMVCTEIGALPPTGTLPTMIWRDWRRAISRQGRIEDMGSDIGEDQPCGNGGCASGQKRFGIGDHSRRAGRMVNIPHCTN